MTAIFMSPRKARNPRGGMPGSAIKPNNYNALVGFNQKHSHYSHRPVRRHGAIAPRSR